MNEKKLGEIEEVMLLLVGIPAEVAYAFNLAEENINQTKRNTSIGVVHSR